MSEEIAKNLEFCYDNYSHEGEFVVLGRHINVFRKCEHLNVDSEKEEEENGWGGSWETPPADCGAFIDEDYFTGWFEEDLGNDLRYVMKDVLKHIFKVSDIIAFTIKGDVNIDDVEIPELEIKKGLKTDILKVLENFGFKGAVLKLSFDYDRESFVATFRGPATLLSSAYVYLDDLAQDVQCDYLRSCELEPLEPSVKEFMDTAFETKIDFY